MFYMGNSFDKETNKKYKTLENGTKAAQKNGMNLYDEDGNVVATASVSLVDEVPEGVMQENPDGSVNTFDEEGNETGTISTEEAETAMEEAGQEWQEAQEDNTPKEEEVKGKIRRVFKGKLRIRREASWDRNAICGVTMFTEKTAVLRVTVDGKTMYKTADGLYVSGDPELVEFIPEE